jgi:hypothetical protein
LLALVPRSGLRQLLARAREGGGGQDAASTTLGTAALDVPREDPDSMTLLVRYVLRILPLPPYERWVEAYVRDRRPFLEELGIPPVPARSEPVLVDVRPAGDGWIAELHLLRTGGQWRGFLCFSATREGKSSGGPYRTADIFRGPDPEELLARFRGFHAATLDAFLRSVRT